MAHLSKRAAAWLSVASNTTLVGLKVAVGLAIGSVAVLSEAIHSGIDLIAALIALYAVSESSKPADADHAFGHGKFENASGTVEALLIFLAAGWIIYEAVHKLLAPSPLEHASLGVAVMLVSAGVNLVVSQVLFSVARRTHSVALEADGWHLRTDVYTSAGVMAAMAVISIGAMLNPSLPLAWVDPVAAILVALLILRAAWVLTKASARDLLDVQLPDLERLEVCQIIRSFQPRVRGFHELRTRKAGHYRFIEFHAFVDAQMSVQESHALAHELAAAVRQRFPETAVNVHVEPCGGNCNHKCADGCFLDQQSRPPHQPPDQARGPDGASPPENTE
jgi:cation diffusion facilitator family transporter